MRSSTDADQEKLFPCSYCGHAKRVLRAENGVTICVDCAALAMHVFTEQGVLPEPVTFTDRVWTEDELERMKRADDDDEDE